MERIKLKAREGMIFVSGGAYGSEILLGCGDCPENWTEITLEEFERLREEAERLDE